MAKMNLMKSVVRGIQTKRFEQVTITVERGEEIEFEDEKEKNQKVDAFTKGLIDDFTTTYNEVCTKLGVDRLIGHVEVQDSGSDDASGSNGDGGDDEEEFSF